MTSFSAGQVAELRKKIFAKQTVFAEVMREHGHKTLYDYVQRLYDWHGDTFSERRREAIKVISDIVDERLGKQLSEEVKAQLDEFPIVSTTDHHSWLQDPFWLNADLLQALGIMSAAQLQLKHVVVLSFSSISLNNKDGYPKGVVWHDAHGHLCRAALFSDKDKRRVVYATPALSKENIQSTLPKANGITPFVKAAFSDPAVMGSSTLVEQISRFNNRLWKTLWHTHNASPELIYIEIETVVTQTMLRHLTDESSLLYKLFFDTTMRSVASSEFVDLRGGFNEETKRGSFFFWGIDTHFHRVALFLYEGTLKSEDDTIAIPWKADSIAAALKSKQLMPGMLLCYLVISLYYGFKCFGGFCQVQDLTAIKHAWQRVLRQVGQGDEAERVGTINTKTFLGDAALVQLPGGIPATSWDVPLYELERDIEFYLNRAKNITLDEMLVPMIPSMYEVIRE